MHGGAVRGALFLAPPVPLLRARRAHGGRVCVEEESDVAVGVENVLPARTRHERARAHAPAGGVLGLLEVLLAVRIEVVLSGADARGLTACPPGGCEGCGGRREEGRDAST